MRYKIMSNGKVIAAFLTASDRDLCLAVLRETYDDVEFEAKDGD